MFSAALKSSRAMSSPPAADGQVLAVVNAVADVSNYATHKSALDALK